MTFPLTYIVLAATFFDIPMRSCASILLSPFYYLLSFSVVLAGYGLWDLRRWSWYLFLAIQVFLVYENAVFAFTYSESHHRVVAFLIITTFQLLVVYKVALDVRVPYLFPSIRWWESNARYRLSVPVTLLLQNGEKLTGEILDLSVLGCFIKIRNELPQDEPVTLRFDLFGQSVECSGLVVWLAQSKVTHPKGMGVKFSFLSKSQKRVLRVIHRRLKRISTFYRRFRYLLSQEEFLKKLEEMEAREIG